MVQLTDALINRLEDKMLHSISQQGQIDDTARDPSQGLLVVRNRLSTIDTTTGEQQRAGYLYFMFKVEEGVTLHTLRQYDNDDNIKVEETALYHGMQVKHNNWFIIDINTNEIVGFVHGMLLDE